MQLSSYKLLLYQAVLFFNVKLSLPINTYSSWSVLSGGDNIMLLDNFFSSCDGVNQWRVSFYAHSCGDSQCIAWSDSTYYNYITVLA